MEMLVSGVSLLVHYSLSSYSVLETKHDIIQSLLFLVCYVNVDWMYKWCDIPVINDCRFQCDEFFLLAVSEVEIFVMFPSSSDSTYSRFFFFYGCHWVYIQNILNEQVMHSVSSLLTTRGLCFFFTCIPTCTCSHTLPQSHIVNVG